MLVFVGLKNAAKLKAAELAFARYFENVKVKGFSVESGVSRQPLTLEKTIEGAANRAKAAWGKGKCDFAVGSEAGLFPVPKTRSGYMDIGVDAIFDGKEIFLGFTPAFEYSKEVVGMILKEGKEISEAFRAKWNEDTRDMQGAIGRLTKGEVPRDKLHEIGLIMALVQIVNKKYYG